MLSNFNFEVYVNVTEAIEDLAVQDIDILCADDQIRRCYLIIASIMTDYSEQVLITEIKKNHHCSMCLVSFNKREDLIRTWKSRTHEYICQMIETQRKDSDLVKDSMIIYDLKNFVWHHYLVNVHIILTVDILHQLLKRIVMRLIIWIQNLIKDHVISAAIKRTKKEVARSKKSLKQSVADVKLNYRFHQILSFVSLKLFKDFSKMKQWSDNEQKTIVQQLMTIITFLLIKRVSAALHCAWAIFDFVTLAQYTFHDSDTLRYMQHALYCINKLKAIFRKYWLSDASNTDMKEINDWCFNILKLHAMMHYTECIWMYESAQNFDTCYKEATHKFLLKNSFIWINKNDEFKTQLLQNNILHHNMTAMLEVITMLSTNSIVVLDHQLEMQITQSCRNKLNLNDYLRFFHENTFSHFDTWELNTKYCRSVNSMTQDIHLDVSDFIDVLTMFVQESRKKWNDVSDFIENWRRREINSSWVKDMFILIHSSLICWIHNEKNDQNLEQLIKKTVRCSLNWRFTDQTRNDYIWISDEATRSWESYHDDQKTLHMMIDYFQLIISIYDHKQLNDKSKCRVYIDALIALHRLKNNEKVNKIHEMFEVKSVSITMTKQSRELHNHCFFEMHDILRSAHIILIEREKHYYVNNFVDWNQYNTIYNSEFMTKDIRIADKFAKQIL